MSHRGFKKKATMEGENVKRICCLRDGLESKHGARTSPWGKLKLKVVLVLTLEIPPDRQLQPQNPAARHNVSAACGRNRTQTLASISLFLF